MRKMAIVCVTALALAASALIAGTPSAKTYRFNLAVASSLAGNQLAAGDYTVAVDTASVRIVESRTGKAIEVPAKVDNVEKKFTATAVSTEKVNGVPEIRGIRLGGSKIQIEFR